MPKNTENGAERRACVIGAGASGVISAKNLLSLGFDVTVYEAGSYVGGVWKYDNDNGYSVAYRNLHVNSEKRITQVPGFPMDPSWPDFPSHDQMHQYYTDYAKHFGVMDVIRFNDKVTRVIPVVQGHGEGWRVTAEQSGEQTYDFVVVANGHLHAPILPTVEGEFTGDVIHSSAYRDPAPFVDRRVLIVGIGNSAVDIASDIATVTESLVVSSRSGAVVAPSYGLFGIPMPKLGAYLRNQWVPTALSKRMIKRLALTVNGRLTKYGLPEPAGRTHPTANQFFAGHVRYGRIRIKPGVQGCSGRTVEFADGTSQEFDVLIAATGYRMSFPFLAEDIFHVADNRAELYLRVVDPNNPGLYFVGLINPNSVALNPSFDLQSKWIGEIEARICKLPEADEMRQAIGERQARTEREFLDRPRLRVEEDFYPYSRELNRARMRGREFNFRNHLRILARRSV